MAPAPPARDPYEALAELADRELELAGLGRYDAVLALARERDAIIARLPASPPPHARATLERAALTQERVSIELMRGQAQILFGLRRIEHVRRVARGYRRSVPETAAAHVDATA